MPKYLMLFGIWALATKAYGLIDFNGNGVSDIWEAEYSITFDDNADDHNYRIDGNLNGILGESLRSASDEGNLDGDEFTNYIEWVIGSDPTTSNLLYQKVNVTQDATNRTYANEIETAVGGSYTLQHSVDLISWGTVSGVPVMVGDGTTKAFDDIVFTLANAPQRIFYRTDIDAEYNGDLDHLDDREEALLNTNPLLADSDGDGVKDDGEYVAGLDPNSNVDTDGPDGLPDDWELFYFGNLSRDGSGDYDGDLVLDADEYTAGTDPTDNEPIVLSYTLPVAQVGQPFKTRIISEGGNGLVLIELVSPSTLPSGLELNEYGVLMGTPSVAGSFTFDVRGVDHDGPGASATISIDVVPVYYTTQQTQEDTLEDSYIVQSAPTQNYNGIFLNTRYSSTQEQRAYLKFDVSGITQRVQKAVMRIYLDQGGDDSAVAFVKEVIDDSWTEGTLNYNNAPKPGNYRLDQIIKFNSDDDNSYVEFDVTDFIAREASGDGTASIALGHSGDNSTIWFYPSERSSPPYLIIDEVESDSSPILVTQTMPVAKATDSYSFQLNSIGGNGDITFELVNGETLPPGLILNPDGTVTGPASTPGVYDFDVKVADQDGDFDTDTINLTVISEYGEIAATDAELLADARVTEVNPTTPYGNDNALYTSNVDTSYLKFDIGDVNGPISDAKLRIYLDNFVVVNEAEVTLYTVSDDSWVESGANEIIYNNRPSVGDVIWKGTLTETEHEDTYVEFDVSEYVINEYSLSDNVVGFALDAEIQTWYISWNSKEGSNPNEPQLIVNAALPNQVPTVTTYGLPVSREGVYYSAQFYSTAGNGSLTWIVDSGNLPGGIDLSPSGFLSGTANEMGTFSFRARVTDSENDTTFEDIELVVISEFSDFDENTIPITEDSYVQNTSPDSNNGNNSALRSGLNGNVEYKSIFKADTSTVTQEINKATLRLYYDRLTFTSASTNDAVVSALVNDAWVESTVTYDNMPPVGRALLTQSIDDSAEVDSYIEFDVTEYFASDTINDNEISFLVSGSPSTLEWDSSESTFKPEIVFETVAPNKIPDITTQGLTLGQVGVAYTQQLYTTAGNGVLSWNVIGGQLPDGLILGSDGLIDGTPLTLGTFNFTVEVEDSEGDSDTAILSIDIISQYAEFEITQVDAVDDAYIYSQSENNNFGGLTIFRTGASGPNVYESLIKFDLSSFSGPIENCKLRLYYDGLQSGTSTTNLRVYSVIDDSWNENTVTYGLAPDYDRLLGSIAVNNATDLDTYLEIDITDYCASEIADGFLSVFLESDGTSIINIASSESSNGPQLEFNTQAPNKIPSITTPVIPNATLGLPYNFTIESTPGNGGLIWSIDIGVLPNGIDIGANDGVLIGTPTELGSFPLTVEVEDLEGDATTRNFTLEVLPDVVPQITAENLPNGIVGEDYNHLLKASNINGSLTWQVVNGLGDLPDGLVLNTSSGLISGTPTTAETQSFTVRADDSDDDFDTEQFSLTIEADLMPNITTTSMPNGNYEVEYSVQLESTSGNGSLTWSSVGDPLPDGLSLNENSGEITGTPTASGTYSFTIQVADIDNDTDTQNLSITIEDLVPSITTSALPDGSVVTTYSGTLEAIGGDGALSWDYESGNLPPGLDVNSDGSVTGQPIQTGSFTFDVEVTDENGSINTAPIQIDILPDLAPVIMTQNLLPAKVSEPTQVEGFGLFAANAESIDYYMQLMADSGDAPLTWSLALGILPEGLSLSPDGVISGSTEQEGKFTITVQVTDFNNDIDSKTFDLVVVPEGSVTTTIALPVIDDAYVEAGANASQNYGSSSDLYVDDIPEQTSYFKFGLEGITKPIESAKLRLRVRATAGSSKMLDIHSVADNNWDEETITYNIAPTVGSRISSEVIGQSFVIREFDITDEVISKIGNSDFITIAFKSVDGQYRFYSKEYISGRYTPSIVVTYPVVSSGGNVSISALNNGHGRASGSGVYPVGTDVTLTAIPNDSAQFIRWTGDLEGAASAEQFDEKLTLTLNENRVVRAYFQDEYFGPERFERSLAQTGAQNGDEIGKSVSISDRFAVVGAPYFNGSASDSGEVFVYEWDGTAWTESDTLSSYTSLSSGELFGADVAIHHNSVAVLAQGTGLVYNFEFNGQGWDVKGSPIDVSNPLLGTAQQWEFTNDAEGWFAANHITNFGQSNGALNGELNGADPYMHSAPGLNIDLDENKLIEIRMKASGGTTAQVFFVTAADGTWDGAKSQVFNITGDDQWRTYWIDMSAKGSWTGTLTQFRLDPIQTGAVSGQTFSVDYVRIGYGVTGSASPDWKLSVYNENLAVGSVGIDGSDVLSGFVDIFEYKNNAWTLEQRVTSNSALPLDAFGESISLSDDTLVVGAPYTDVSSNNNAGAVYVFRKEGQEWSEEASLSASDGLANDRFGDSVDVFDDQLAVGASLGDGTVTDSGTVYVFDFDSTTEQWNEQGTKLFATSGAQSDEFGASVVLSGTGLAVGAPSSETGGLSNAGSFHLYEFDGSNWQLIESLDGTVNNEHLGASVDVYGYSSVAGAPSSNTLNTDSGSVRIVEYPEPFIEWVSPDDPKNLVTGESLDMQASAGVGRSLVGPPTIFYWYRSVGRSVTGSGWTSLGFVPEYNIENGFYELTVTDPNVLKPGLYEISATVTDNNPTPSDRVTVRTNVQSLNIYQGDDWDVNADSDGDSLNDYEELLYFGSLDVSNGGSDNFDGDAMTDAQELANGTDPTDNTDALPTVAETYPRNGSTVALPTNAGYKLYLSFLLRNYGGGDNYQLFDSDGNEITSHISEAPNGGDVEITIDPDDDKYVTGGHFHYELVLNRTGEDSRTFDLFFRIDTTLPVVEADKPGGIYQESVILGLSASEPLGNGKILYTLDGSEPVDVVGSTVEYTSPFGISMPVVVRYRAIDNAGNIGPVGQGFYRQSDVFDALASNIGATFIPDNGTIDDRVEVIWSLQGAGFHTGFNIYRAENIYDIDALENSREHGHAPPQYLRINDSEITLGETSYNDFNVLFGGKPVYGISVVDGENEGIISELFQIDLQTSVVTANRDEAVERALVWLNSSQNRSGSWGAGDVDDRLIATSSVLNGLLGVPDWPESNSTIVNRALGYLQRERPQSNRALASVIDTLQNYDLEPYWLHTQLTLYSYAVDDNPLDSQPAQIVGWADSGRQYPNAFNTALGLIAQRNAKYYDSPLPSQVKGFLGGNSVTIGSLTLDGTVLESENSNRFGWGPEYGYSYHVSSVVYHALAEHRYSTSSAYSWLTGATGSDRSTVDIATRMIYMIRTNSGVLSNNIATLIERQNVNGSWEDDAYLTGVCLKALAKPKVFYIYGGLSNNNHDFELREIFENRGYQIVLHNDQDVFPSDLSPYSMVFISGTADPVIVGSNFKSTKLPVVVNHFQLFDDMGMAGKNALDTGSESGQTAIDVLDSGNHLLSANYVPTSGLAIMSSGSDFSWADVKGNPRVIATITGAPDKKVIYGYESGQILEDGTQAQGKRLALFLRNNANNLDNTGKDFVDAAIEWALLERAPR